MITSAVVAGSLLAACAASRPTTSPAPVPVVSARAPVAPPAVSGRVAWARGLGGKGPQKLLALGVDPQGTVLVGGSFRESLPLVSPPLVSIAEWPTSSPWLAALGPDGETTWARQIGGPRSEGYVSAIAPLADGILIAGMFGHNDLIGLSMEWQPAVVRLDREGEPQWALGLGRDVTIHAVSADERGGALVVGGYVQKLPIGDETLEPLGAGRAITCFALRLDGSGKARWVRRYGGPEGCVLLGGAWLPGGDAVVTGTVGAREKPADFGSTQVRTTGEGDVLLMRLDPDGNTRWLKHWGIGKDSAGNLLGADPDGKIWVAGLATEGLALGGEPLERGLFVARFGPAGEHLGSQTLRGLRSSSLLFDLRVDREGRLALLGGAVGEFELGGMRSSSSQATGARPERELFVALLDPQGQAMSIDRFGRGQSSMAQIALAPGGDLLLGATLATPLELRGRQVEHPGDAGDEDFVVARFSR